MAPVELARECFRMPLGLPPGKKIVPVVSAFWRGTLPRPEHLVAPRASCAIAPNKVGQR
jgi:hypothetical protein